MMNYVKDHWLICGSWLITVVLAFFLTSVRAQPEFTAAVLSLIASTGVYLQQQLDTKGNRSALIKKLIEDAKRNQLFCDQIFNAARKCQNELNPYVSNDIRVNADRNLHIHYNIFVDLATQVDLRKISLSSHERELLSEAERKCTLAAADMINSVTNLTNSEHLREVGDNIAKSVEISCNMIANACNDTKHNLELLISEFTVLAIKK